MHSNAISKLSRWREGGGKGVDRGSTVTDDNRKSSFPGRWQEVDAVEGGERRRKESGSRRRSSTLDKRGGEERFRTRYSV